MSESAKELSTFVPVHQVISNNSTWLGQLYLTVLGHSKLCLGQTKEYSDQFSCSRHIVFSSKGNPSRGGANLG